MNIEKFNSRIFNANCYVVSNDRQAIIIDPCVPLSNLKKELENKEVLGIFLTHGHFDHISNLEEYLKVYDVKIYCHKNAKEKLMDEKKNYSTIAKKPLTLNYDDVKYCFLKEGTFNLGDISINVIETPGHTDCSLCYVIDGNMFSGDTLFKGSVGRCDLYSGNTYKLMQSIEKIKRLDPELIVYPGHDGITSIKIEKITNRYLI